MIIFMIGLPLIVLLTLFSIILLSGKGSFLIAGYNTASQERKEKYNEKKLCKSVGVMLSIITVATVALFIIMTQKMLLMLIFCIAIYPVFIMFSVISTILYVNKRCIAADKAGSSSFYLPKHKQNTRRRFILLCVCLFVLVLTLLITIVLVLTSRPPVYTISKGSLIISSSYGETVKLSEIKNVQLKGNIPNHLSKIRGLNFGPLLKGKFLFNNDEINVYVDTTRPPYLYLNTSSGLIIINDQTASKTQLLYTKLQSSIKSMANLSK